MKLAIFAWAALMGLAVPVKGQTLGEVLSSLQERKRVVEQGEQVEQYLPTVGGASPTIDDQTAHPVVGTFHDLEDVASVSACSGVVAAAGHAPGPLTSYLKGGPIYGIAVPTDRLALRYPNASDAGANNHFRLGGFTGVEHNGVWKSSNVRELLTPGGGQVPPGSVFFQFNPAGSWTPIRRW